MSTYQAATEIVQKLSQAGFTAYFAGGWVRDYLLKRPCDDIDIATNALPEQIQALFPKRVAVGAAFGIIVVLHRGHSFEVASFRSDGAYIDGRHPTGVIWSSPQMDAQRRDFTVNGMFYDPLNNRIDDFVGGQADLKARVIRAIGDPEARFAEDRLRMLRAVRFAYKLNFAIEPQTRAAIQRWANSLLPSVSIERVWQELQKMAAEEHFDAALTLLYDLGLLQTIFPRLENCTREELQSRLAVVRRLPLQTPAILLLMELFPDATEEEKVALCRFLKTTTADIQLVRGVEAAHHLLACRAPCIELLRFDARLDAELCWAVAYARYPEAEAAKRLSEFQQRQKEWQSQIERFRQRRPIVTATHLQAAGIAPGKAMGALLAAAEEIAVEQRLEEPAAILQQLQKSPLWPKGN